MNETDNVDYEYVGFWARTGAALIDTIIIVAVTFPLLISIYGWAYFEPTENIIQGPADFLISWVLPALGVILFWITKQATPGKMAMRARVVDARTGANITVGQAIGRYLAYLVSMIPLMLGIIWVGIDRRKQGWHDKLAGTVVVRTKNPEPVRFEQGER